MPKMSKRFGVSKRLLALRTYFLSPILSTVLRLLFAKSSTGDRCCQYVLHVLSLVIHSHRRPSNRTNHPCSSAQCPPDLPLHMVLAAVRSSSTHVHIATCLCRARVSAAVGLSFALPHVHPFSTLLTACDRTVCSESSGPYSPCPSKRTVEPLSADVSDQCTSANPGRRCTARSPCTPRCGTSAEDLRTTGTSVVTSATCRTLSLLCLTLCNTKEKFTYFSAPNKLLSSC